MPHRLPRPSTRLPGHHRHARDGDRSPPATRSGPSPPPCSQAPTTRTSPARGGYPRSQRARHPQPHSSTPDKPSPFPQDQPHTLHPGLVHSPSPPPAPLRDPPPLGPPPLAPFDGTHSAHSREHAGPASPACPTSPHPGGLPIRAWAARSHAPSLRSSRAPGHPSCAGGSLPASTASPISTSPPAPGARARHVRVCSIDAQHTEAAVITSPPPRASLALRLRNTVGAGWPPPSNSPEHRRADDKRVGTPAGIPPPVINAQRRRRHNGDRTTRAIATRQATKADCPRQARSCGRPSRDPRCP